MTDHFSVYEGNAPFVFISYSHKETDIVLPVVRELAARGVRVWYDGGLEAGTEWPETIARHLLKSQCVVAFASKNFGDSHNCRRELDFAIARHKDPVVVYLEDPEKLSEGVQMQLISLHALYYDRFPDVRALVDALMKAALVKACVSSEEIEMPPEPQPIPFATTLWPWEAYAP